MCKSLDPRSMDRKLGPRELEADGPDSRPPGPAEVERGNDREAEARGDQSEQRGGGIGGVTLAHGASQGFHRPALQQLVGGVSTKGQEGQPLESAHVDATAPRRRMQGRDHQESPEPGHLLYLEVVGNPWEVVDEEIHLAQAECLEVGRPRLAQDQADLREPALQPEHPRRKQLLDQQRRGGDAKRPAEVVPAEGIDGGAQPGEEGGHHLVELAALGGERHPVPGHAAEETDPQLLLQPLHLLVHARLGDRVRERSGCAGVAAGLGHPVEAGQTVQ